MNTTVKRENKLFHILFQQTKKNLYGVWVTPSKLLFEKKKNRGDEFFKRSLKKQLIWSLKLEGEKKRVFKNSMMMPSLLTYNLRSADLEYQKRGRFNI